MSGSVIRAGRCHDQGLAIDPGTQTHWGARMQDRTVRRVILGVALLCLAGVGWRVAVNAGWEPISAASLRQASSEDEEFEARLDRFMEAVKGRADRGEFPLVLLCPEDYEVLTWSLAMKQETKRAVTENHPDAAGMTPPELEKTAWAWAKLSAWELVEAVEDGADLADWLPGASLESAQAAVRAADWLVEHTEGPDDWYPEQCLEDWIVTADDLEPDRLSETGGGSRPGTVSSLSAAMRSFGRGALRVATRGRMHSR